MDIIWHGYSCFTIKTKRGTVVIDPYATAAVGLKLPAMKADAVLVSHDHEGHNNVKAVSGTPKVISWAGEYEIAGIAIMARAVPYTAEGDAKTPGKGLLFNIDAEGLKVCFMGDMGSQPDEALIESIGDVDVLMIPVGGHHTMDAKQAHLVVEELEPRAVIPMHYAVKGTKVELDGPEAFLKQFGGGSAPKDKFSIGGRSDLPEDKMECVVLNPQTA